MYRYITAYKLYIWSNVSNLDCPIESQVYQTSDTCTHTCTMFHYICAQDNLPSCSCPSGQVIDEEKGRCVYPQDCPSKKCFIKFEFSLSS